MNRKIKLRCISFPVCLGFCTYKEGVRIQFYIKPSSLIHITKYSIEYKEKESCTVMLKRVVARQKYRSLTLSSKLLTLIIAYSYSIFERLKSIPSSYNDR